jgi:hypothetical protein
MRHKLIEKMINRAHKVLNNGYDGWIEVMGHGCPLGMGPICLLEGSNSTHSPKPFEVYTGEIIFSDGSVGCSKDKKHSPAPTVFEGDIKPFIRGFSGNPCRMYRFRTISPVLDMYPLFKLDDTEYAAKKIAKRNEITKQRLKNGTAEYVNGVIWYKARK